MTRLNQRRVLSHVENRVALMHVAGAKQTTIAYMLECSQGAIEDILKRPHVARQILLLTGVAGDSLSLGVENLNSAIEQAAVNAFEVEYKNMLDLDQIGDGLNETGDVIKAKVAASNIAQDILDRAGKRAPTRVDTRTVSMQIPERAVEQMVKVMSEMQGGEGTLASTNHQEEPYE